MTSYLNAGRTGLVTVWLNHIRANPRSALVGYGSGSPAWDGAIPAVPRETTELAAPFAYVTAYAVDFALLTSEVEDPAPVPVTVNGIDYDPVLTPTPLLLIRARLPGNFATDDDLVVREIGLSFFPTFANGVGLTQSRFVPSEVSDVGDMALIRRMAPVAHDGSNSGIDAAFLLEI